MPLLELEYGKILKSSNPESTRGEKNHFVTV